MRWKHSIIQQLWMFWGSKHDHCYRELAFQHDQSETQVAWFSQILPCPPFSCDVVHFSISLTSQIVFQSNQKPCEHQSVETKAYFFVFKDRPEQQAVAEVGIYWHMLVHIGKRVEPTQWLPSHRGLPKKLQMSALYFSPILLSCPLYSTLILLLSVCLPVSFSLYHIVASFFHSLCLSPAQRLLIWWRERLNICLASENTLVTIMCVFEWVSTGSIFIR